MQLTKGDYITETGWKAKVCQLKMRNGDWFWTGAIWDHQQGIWITTMWSPSGKSLAHPAFNIFEKAGE